MIRKRSICWAVTGPTGAGKSRLCHVFAERGAFLIEADIVAHGLLDRPRLQRRLADAFGKHIIGSGGLIDRAALGRIVFHDPAAREELDDLVHPPLSEALRDRLDAARCGGSPLVILEAAVYFLLPGPPPVDWTLAVLASADVRLARLIAKGMDRAAALARIAAQAHLESTWALADCIVDNDGSKTALDALADDLWRTRIAPETQDGCI
jgi:dephospho-CoA kinase